MDRIITDKGDIALLSFNLRKLYTIVLASGTFDFFHSGHLFYLKEAKKLGEFLIVSMNSDKSIREIKGDDRPFVPEQYRAEMLVSLTCVDFVYIFDEKLPNDAIKNIRPDIYVKGDEYKNRSMPEKKIVEQCGGKVRYLPTMLKSSTRMMKLLEENFGD